MVQRLEQCAVIFQVVGSNLTHTVIVGCISMCPTCDERRDSNRLNSFLLICEILVPIYHISVGVHLFMSVVECGYISISCYSSLL